MISVSDSAGYRRPCAVLRAYYCVNSYMKNKEISMNEYVVISDVAGDLPADLAVRMGIELVPMKFEMDGRVYTHYADNREMSSDEFYTKLGNGSMPKTSQINPNEYEEFVRPYLEDGRDILVITFSSGLSGSIQSMNIAADILRDDYPDRKIYVVDSLCASVGQGVFLYNVMQHKDEMSIEELRDWVVENRLKTAHWFMVDDLFHLKRGGRVSSVEAVFGTALSIKPVLTVDEKGKLAVVGKVRGTKKGVNYIIDKFLAEGRDTQNQTVFIGHTRNKELAEELKKTLIDRGLIKDVVVTEIGPIIGTHVGLGFIALTFMR